MSQNPYGQPGQPGQPGFQPGQPGFQPGQPGFQPKPNYNPNMKPHRGGLVLTMGILAIVFNFCAIPGILAWIWGGADLKEMKSGRMDPSGQGITQAGYILGIIGTVIITLTVLYAVFVLVMFAGGAAAGI